MKLIELEIQNIRGIVSLRLTPDGKNLVIWGPNGVGKSAVIDALDFLLTGSIARLSGKGTGNIHLTTHGKHIDHTPEEAKISATFRLPGIAQPIKLERSMDSPGILHCDPDHVELVQPIIELARNGQHILTRREILRYITSDPGSRAQGIQELLNISEVEVIRKSLVKVSNDSEKNYDQTKRAVASAKQSVLATTQERVFVPSTVLAVVNRERIALGGTATVSYSAKNLKADITPPAQATSPGRINVALIERDINNIMAVRTEELKADLNLRAGQLNGHIAQLRSTPSLRREVGRRKLTELGIQQMDESGACPLCDTPWKPGELVQHLQKHLAEAAAAAEIESIIESHAQFILDTSARISASVKNLINTADQAKLTQLQMELQAWSDRLNILTQALAALMEGAEAFLPGPDQICELMAPAECDSLLQELRLKAQTLFPAVSPEQTAWDTLTRLEENLGTLERVENESLLAYKANLRAKILESKFISARDEVLGALYLDVKDRFVSLYRKLHGDDERDFSAVLRPEGAGLELGVEYKGHGIHPPHALHSEGHQDSMGLCLYLALAERLNGGKLDLILLDDVVMSVDAEHRRQLSRLLASDFPNRQFLITTHDKTWSTQLRTEGVVNSKGVVEFNRWSIETGPLVNQESDLWARIEQELQNGEVSTAAFRLRRGSEQFAEMMCDSLQAPVRYRSDARWELGDLLKGAMFQYGDLVKKAKISAQSWGNKELQKQIELLDSQRSQIYRRVNLEQWAVNANVHYNNWANFSVEDFRSVIEAFHDLYGLFFCPECEGAVYLATNGMALDALRCNCGHMNWNLKEKSKAKAI